MVLRLFVQPGENKLWITPRRPEPLPANATITASVLTSTVLAAGYTSYASGYARRVGISNGLSVPALFLRSSAKAGFWCAAIGAAVNFYHHHEFTKPIGAALEVPGVEWKLWEKTDKYTVDDGFLAGTGLGLGIGLLSSLFMRRSPLRWWTRCMGMANLGAFAGIAGSNAYFQYTGERQKAVAVLEHWRRRRNLEFHHIYWDKLLLTRLSLPVQAYVVLNGIFRAASLPEEALDTPEKYGLGVYTDVSPPPPSDSATTPTTPGQKNITEAEPAPPQVQPYYRPVQDYASYLQGLDMDSTEHNLADLLVSQELLESEIAYIAQQLAHQHRDVVFKDFPDTDERQLRLTEAHVLRLVFETLMRESAELDIHICSILLSMQHKTAMDRHRTDVRAWVPAIYADDKVQGIEPTVTLAKANMMRERFLTEIKFFEEQARRTEMARGQGSAISGEARDMARRNLEEGRLLLRAVDRLVWRLEAEGLKEKGTKEIGQAMQMKNEVVEAKGPERRDGEVKEKGKEKDIAEEKSTKGNAANELPSEEVPAKGQKAKETKPDTRNLPPKGVEPDH